MKKIIYTIFLVFILSISFADVDILNDNELNKNFNDEVSFIEENKKDYSDDILNLSEKNVEEKDIVNEIEKSTEEKNLINENTDILNYEKDSLLEDRGLNIENKTDILLIPNEQENLLDKYFYIPDKINIPLGSKIKFDKYLKLKDVENLLNIKVSDIAINDSAVNFNEEGSYKINYSYNGDSKEVLVNVNNNIKYLSDNIYKFADYIKYSTAYSEMRINTNFSNARITLKNSNLTDDNIFEYHKGIALHSDAYLIFDNLSGLGIDEIEGFFGIDSKTNNPNLLINVSIKLDGQEYKTYLITPKNSSPYFNIDLRGKDKLEIRFKTNSLGGAHTVIADAKIVLNTNEYIADFKTKGLEFSKKQVNRSNILENVNVKLNELDITDTLDYETDYDGGIGEYNIKYKAFYNDKEFVQNCKMQVSEDKILYKMDDEELFKPFKNSIYWGRNILSNEGQKTWDFVLRNLLKYNTNILIKDTNMDFPIETSEYRISNDGRRITFKLYNNGIRILPDEIVRIRPYLVRNDSRMFLIHDGGESYKLKINGFGYVDTFELGIHEAFLTKNSYFDILRKIEDETEKYFEKIKDDMTDSQINSELLQAISRYIRYGQSGEHNDLRGAFLKKTAICGGYSKAMMYLLQKSLIQNIWVEGYVSPNKQGYHAWNFVKLEDGKWYMDDSTWGAGYISVGMVNLFTDNAIPGVIGRWQNSTFYKMPNYEKKDFPRNLLKYPNIDIVVNPKILIEKNNQFNIYNYINAIYDNINTSYAELENNLTKIGDVDTSILGDNNIGLSTHNSAGNIVNKNINVKVVDSIEDFLNDRKFYKLAELEHLSHKDGYAGFRKSNVSDSNISLLDENGKEMNEKITDFIYMHAPSFIEYNLSNDYDYFTGYVGINKTARNNVLSNVKFKIFIDNTEVYRSKEIKSNTPAEKILIGIPENSKKIQFVFDDLGYNSNDHSLIAMPRFISKNSNIKETIPVIYANDLIIRQNDALNLLLNVTAYDEIDGDLEVKIKYSNVNPGVVGIYKVVYETINYRGFSVEKEIKVIVEKSKDENNSDDNLNNGTNAGDNTSNGGTNAGDNTSNGGINAGDNTSNGGINAGDNTSNGGTNAGDNTSNGGTNAGDNTSNGGTNAGNNTSNGGTNAGDNTSNSLINAGNNILNNKVDIENKNLNIYKYVEENKGNGIIEFKDISSHWAKSHIEFVSKNRFMIGDENFKFNPEKYITISEFLTIMKRIDNINRKYDYNVNLNMKNIDSNSWYYDTIKWAVYNKYIEDNDKFDPNSIISRYDMCNIIEEFINSNKLNVYNKNKNSILFEDIDIHDEKFSKIFSLVEKGIIQGKKIDDKYYFDYNSGTKRSEVAKIIEKMLIY